MTIYIGNISHSANSDDLVTLFSNYGEVTSAKIIMDNFTGRSKGFGFVEMADDESAKKAIDALNETEFMTRNIVVNEARPRTEGGASRPRNNFNRGGNGGGGFNRGGGDRGGNNRY